MRSKSAHPTLYGMKFQLPQFVELETKLVGPFTLKQSLWVAAGGAIVVLEFLIFRGIWFFVFGIPTIIVFGGLAFAKIEGIPLTEYVAYMLSYSLNPRKYIFKKEGEEEPLYKQEDEQHEDTSTKDSTSAT